MLHHQTIWIKHAGVAASDCCCSAAGVLLFCCWAAAGVLLVMKKSRLRSSTGSLSQSGHTPRRVLQA